jgi:hypothetical protein
LAAYLNGLIGMCDLESKIDGLLLAQGGGHGVVLLWFEALGFHLHRVYPRLQLWKVEAAGVVGTRAYRDGMTGLRPVLSTIRAEIMTAEWNRAPSRILFHGAAGGRVNGARAPELSLPNSSSAVLRCRLR